jgi:nicotinate-nucleotide adenylyltransferase
VPVARLGILGGAFNPPHLGHLALARHALGELGLERVLLMPACLSPHKRSAEDPGPGHRLRMCRLAIEDDRRRHPGDSSGGLAACSLELERGGLSYTVDTLRAIHAAHPDAELTLIVGADVARTLPSWREPAELLALADLAVALRAGTGADEVLDALATLLADPPPADRQPADKQPSGEHLRFLDMPVIDVSSSQVRDCVWHEGPVEELLGPGVASYIAEHDLYRRPVKASVS